MIIETDFTKTSPVPIVSTLTEVIDIYSDPDVKGVTLKRPDVRQKLKKEFTRVTLLNEFHLDFSRNLNLQFGEAGNDSARMLNEAKEYGFSFSQEFAQFVHTDLTQTLPDFLRQLHDQTGIPVNSGGTENLFLMNREIGKHNIPNFHLDRDAIVAHCSYFGEALKLLDETRLTDVPFSELISRVSVESAKRYHGSAFVYCDKPFQTTLGDITFMKGLGAHSDPSKNESDLTPDDLKGALLHSGGGAPALTGLASISARRTP